MELTTPYSWNNNVVEIRPISLQLNLVVKSYLQKIHVKRKLLDVQYSFNQCFS